MALSEPGDATGHFKGAGENLSRRLRHKAMTSFNPKSSWDCKRFDILPTLSVRNDLSIPAMIVQPSLPGLIRSVFFPALASLRAGPLSVAPFGAGAPSSGET